MPNQRMALAGVPESDLYQAETAVIGATDQPSTAAFAARDRVATHSHPSRLYPDHEHIGEPGAQHSPALSVEG